MHDLIHDLALWAADGLCEVVDATNTLQGLKRARHVFLTSNAATLVNQLSLTSKLRTFQCLEVQCIDVLKFVPRLEYIRTLCLRLDKMEVLPEYVGELKHLRFLSLRLKNIKELPTSMANLWNLQTLWLKGCYKLEKLPNIRFLGNLRHLKIGSHTNLKEMPMGIVEFINLQSLDHFVLGDGGGERIRDLKSLNHLQGKVRISGLESVMKVEDAKEAQVDKKDGLDKLCLVWSNKRKDIDDKTERNVLEQLKPHRSIKKLKLDGYRGLRFPNWLRTPCFSEMVSIVLKGCDKCENLPALGQLPSLKNLEIERMDGIKEIGAEFYGCQNPSFPVLEYLSFEGMGSLEKWVHSPAHDCAFPRLQELFIGWCNSLKKISPHLPSLKDLRIVQCELEIIVSLQRLPLLEDLEVGDCGGIRFTSDEKIVKSDGVGCSSVVGAECVKDSFELAHLTKLTIECCSGRISLPGGLLLPAVEHVTFRECQDLGSLPSQLHNYTSLKNLTIFRCNTMEWLPEGGLPINLEELSISEVDINQRDPKLILAHLHNLRSLELINVPKLEDLCVPSSLCHLYIKGLSELKNISSDTTLSNIASFEVDECPSLVSLLPELLEFRDRHLHQYSSLKNLTITNCPKIQETSVWGLPTNLEHLRIEYVNMFFQEVGVHHLHSLRSLKLIHVGMTPEDLSLPSSLSRLEIWASPNLKSISSSTTHVSNLTMLWVSDSPEFESLVGNFTSLSHLGISKCPKFQISEEGGLPGNLTELQLRGRMNRDKPIQEWGLHLLSSLHSLKLEDITEEVECIPSPNLLLPTSLTHLDIIGFQNLKTINCSSFPNLICLLVEKCPKFQSFGDHGIPSKLQLYIKSY